MVQNTYFHCAPIRLREGSIIETGNWGRINRDFIDNEARIYRELAYEFASITLNPRAPSRLNCVFCCDNQHQAEAYIRQHSQLSVLHQVEPVDVDAPIFRTMWSLVEAPQQNDGFLQVTEANIQRYWQGNPDRDVEVLIGGTVRVVRSL